MYVSGTIVELIRGYGYVADDSDTPNRYVFVAGSSLSCFKFSQLKLGMRVIFKLNGREVTEMRPLR